MTKHLINGKPYNKKTAFGYDNEPDYPEFEDMPDLKLVKRLKYEKVVIARSKPLNSTKSYQDNMGNNYIDDYNPTGNMIFLADKEKYFRWKKWMKEIGQWDTIDEIYVFDTIHKNGDNMIKRATMKLHEFSYVITLKDAYKHCWWGGEVSGEQLFREYAIDPDNKHW